VTSILPDIAHAPASYNGNVSPNVDGASPELFRMEFYEDMGWTAAPGTYDLGSNGNENYYTCSQCVRVFKDYDANAGTIAGYYFPVSGSMTIQTIHSPPSDNKSKGTLTNVKLVEGYLDDMLKATIVDPSGPCIFIQSASWTTL
jgi:hypothetical protein